MNVQATTENLSFRKENVENAVKICYDAEFFAVKGILFHISNVVV